jgi:hypothetical protein
MSQSDRYNQAIQFLEDGNLSSAILEFEADILENPNLSRSLEIGSKNSESTSSTTRIPSSTASIPFLVITIFLALESVSCAFLLTNPLNSILHSLLH